MEQLVMRPHADEVDYRVRLMRDVEDGHIRFADGEMEIDMPAVVSSGVLQHMGSVLFRDAVRLHELAHRSLEFRFQLRVLAHHVSVVGLELRLRFDLIHGYSP